MATIFSDKKYADTHAVRPHHTLCFDARHVETLNAQSALMEVKQAVRSRKLQQANGAEPGIKDLLPNGNIDAYYLPYRENSTTRITLHPAGKQVDPRFFVTDELNGCMVAVCGPADSPTVYHLNAQAFGGNFANTSEADTPGLIIRKTAEMKRRLRAARTGFPTEPVSNLGTGRLISMNDYLEFESKPAVHAEIVRKIQRALRIDPARYTEFDDFRPSVPTIQAFGTVFGYKDSRHGWSFYVQSRVRVQPWIPTGNNGQTEHDWTQGEASHHVLWTKKFYPTGIGAAMEP